MFVLEFEKALFEFAYETPHWAPLFALPPTFSSSTVCRLSSLLLTPAVEAWKRGAEERFSSVSFRIHPMVSEVSFFYWLNIWLIVIFLLLFIVSRFGSARTPAGGLLVQARR